MKGFIKFFDVRKRHGYIIPNGVSRQDRDRHVYFHEAELDGQEARAGEIVEFSLNPNFPNPIYRNPRALSVQVLSKTSYIDQQRMDPQRKAVAAHGD